MSFSPAFDRPLPRIEASLHWRTNKERPSEALPFGRLWYDGPNASGNAIGYAKFYSRSHEYVIRVFEPGHNRGDDLPADDTQLPSVGL